MTYAGHPCENCGKPVLVKKRVSCSYECARIIKNNKLRGQVYLNVATFNPSKTRWLMQKIDYSAVRYSL